MNPLPLVIQGGMGVGISDWRLARAVSETGQLGVVAGTALDRVLSRRLQLGDPGGHVRRALRHFPLPEIARRVLQHDFVPGGLAPGERFRDKSLCGARLGPSAIERIVVGNFVEVFLAREGHGNPVGVNHLTKVQLPTLPSLFGAMLAGAGYVLMGAGIPSAVPGILDRFARGEAAELALDVAGESADRAEILRFDPAEFCDGTPPRLHRPRFLGIVSTHTAALRLDRTATGAVDGFVVEGSTAGGHNAPPRGRAPLGPGGEPVYGPRDEPDLERIAALGRPFWLAGSYASADRLRRARERGATGVQIGTAFAYCEESGMRDDFKRAVVARVRAGDLEVFTDPSASPTGFPFKIAQLPGTLADPEVSEARTRVCDLGYLRTAYRRRDGRTGWRCPGEPVAAYVAKGGRREDTVGRKCLCNGLLATIGLGQRLAHGRAEPALVTSGGDAWQITEFLPPGASRYRAADVVRGMLGEGGERVPTRGPLRARDQ